MMNMYQRSVREEKEDLDRRLEKLMVFCSQCAEFEALPLMERERLATQRHLMTAYSAVLGAGIEAFDTGDA